MFLFLHTFLPALMLPIGVTLLLLLVGVLSRRQTPILLGFIVLWLSSTPLIANVLVRSAEEWGERRQAIDASMADAIVVLSGGRLVAPGAARVSEWNDADRFYGGVELFQAGKAPLLIFTGGWAPWTPKAKPEGEILIEFAQALGVPALNMLTTGRVINTEEEARMVAALIDRQHKTDKDLRSKWTARGQLRILLVTSAFHMRRAQSLFEREGMQVIPFPVDFKVDEGQVLSFTDLLPSAQALKYTELALREVYGRMFYWMIDQL